MCCMATVLIVSRTQMANGICVGGINEDTGELIRLHNEKGGNLKSDAPYMLGERWNLNIERAWNSRPIPHVEDMQTSPVSMIENIGLKGVAEFVKTQDLGNKFTYGELAETFEGCLHLEGTKNYINRNKIPSFRRNLYNFTSNFFKFIFCIFIRFAMSYYIKTVIFIINFRNIIIQKTFYSTIL